MTGLRIATMLIAMLPLAACGHDDDEDPAAEACEHLKEGPSVPITATASTTNAPAVAADHKRYDVTLGATGGVVSLASAMEAHLLVFLGTDVTLTVAKAMGPELAVSKSATAPPCAEIKARYEAAVGVGTYHLTLGPSPGGSVSLVVETAKH